MKLLPLPQEPIPFSLRFRQEEAARFCGLAEAVPQDAAIDVVRRFYVAFVKQAKASTANRTPKDATLVHAQDIDYTEYVFFRLHLVRAIFYQNESEALKALEPTTFSHILRKPRLDEEL